MKLFTPDYYSQFRCIASACPDSCCHEWEVCVDDDTARYYRTLPGPLGDRLRQVLRHTDDGTMMTIEDRRCPMWRRDGLCQIQCELGHDALCATCREFPRLKHDYGTFAELGLELSCPEAARLILSSSQEFLVSETQDFEDPDYDQQVMDVLLQSRKEVLNFLKSTPLPLNEALAVVLIYSHEVQAAIDGADLLPLDAESALALAKENAQAADPESLTDFFRGLEILTDRWQERLDAPLSPAPWDEKFLALAKYGVLRWWLQAVSDFDLICRAKLIVAMCLMVNLLGGDRVQTAQLFSKEIENSGENVEAILDGAYTAPALTDVNLLSLLLNN